MPGGVVLRFAAELGQSPSPLARSVLVRDRDLPRGGSGRGGAGATLSQASLGLRGATPRGSHSWLLTPATARRARAAAAAGPLAKWSVFPSGRAGPRSTRWSASLTRQQSLLVLVVVQVSPPCVLVVGVYDLAILAVAQGEVRLEGQVVLALGHVGLAQRPAAVEWPQSSSWPPRGPRQRTFCQRIAHAAARAGPALRNRRARLGDAFASTHRAEMAAAAWRTRASTAPGTARPVPCISDSARPQGCAPREPNGELTSCSRTMTLLRPPCTRRSTATESRALLIGRR